MERYVCPSGAYEYDPKEGDPEGGIAPETPFSELPNDWVCPVCGVEKSEFEVEY